MAPLSAKVALLGLLAAPHVAAASDYWSERCTTINQRKSWAALTDDEKSEYIRAEKCLMESDPINDNDSSYINNEYGTIQNIWDQFHYTHIVEGNYIHYTGQFLPWHRYYVRVHEVLLQTQCNYTGAHPYWDETGDTESYQGHMGDSPIWDATTGFGGNGTGTDRGSDCVATGPFANISLHMSSHNKTDYCLTRAWSQSDLNGANSSNVQECFDYANYTDAWSCYNGHPHAAGHGGTGGLMLDPIDSPGDPMFFLHHAWLDMEYWKWQLADYPARLTDMGGNNVMAEENLEIAGLSQVGDDVLDYDGDPGNTTTLNHNLYMRGNMAPNVTVGDVMELNGTVICAEYIY
ncbi:amino acid transporter [Phyllosticta capitalensis]